MKSVDVAMEQHRAIWSSFIHVNYEIKSDRWAGCMQSDWWACRQKHLLGCRQHCMAQISGCEPELLNLYRPTLCQVDLPAWICPRSWVCGSKYIVVFSIAMGHDTLGGVGVKDQGLGLCLLQRTLFLAISTCSTWLLLLLWSDMLCIYLQFYLL